MAVPSSGLKHSYLLVSHHVAPGKTSVFVTLEEKKQKGTMFADSPLLGEGLRLPEPGWSTGPKGWPVPGWGDLGAPLPTAAHQETQLWT